MDSTSELSVPKQRILSFLFFYCYDFIYGVTKIVYIIYEVETQKTICVNTCIVLVYVYFDKKL